MEPIDNVPALLDCSLSASAACADSVQFSIAKLAAVYTLLPSLIIMYKLSTCFNPLRIALRLLSWAGNVS